MAPGYTKWMTDSELKSEFRDLKLKIINNEVDFKPNSLYIKSLSNELDFISNTFPNDIISGSIALKIFGLLKRDINDIDILISDKNRYPSYTKDEYGDEEAIENRLGVRKFDYKRGFFSKKKEYEVDFFENVGSSFIEVNYGGRVLKVHSPLEILDYKINMATNINTTSGSKHNQDLTDIFRHLDMLDYVSEYLDNI